MGAGIEREARIKEADAVKIVYWLDSLARGRAATKKTDLRERSARQQVLSRGLMREQR